MDKRYMGQDDNAKVIKVNVRGKVTHVIFIGKYVDDRGHVYEVHTSIDPHREDYAILRSQKGKIRTVYDTGKAFRNAVSRAWKSGRAFNY